MKSKPFGYNRSPGWKLSYLCPDVPHPSASKQIRAHTVNSATDVLKRCQ